MRNRLPSFCVSGLFLFAASLCGQDAEEILQKVQETYQTLNSGQFELRTTAITSTGQTESARETNYVVAFTRPDRILVEIRYPDAGTWVRASNGQKRTEYRDISDLYQERAASPDDLRLLSSTPISSYEAISDGLKSAKILRSEPVQVNGHTVDAYVIEVEYDRPSRIAGTILQPSTFWIGKEHFLVLRHVSGTKSKASESVNTRTIDYTLAQVNKPIPDALFVVSRKK
ncbi:MAG: LolA family protein [Bryobacteraceae bacterium]